MKPGTLGYDRSGRRKYATVIDTKAGMRLGVDREFDCRPRKLVEEDDNGLFVRCDKGKHYLEGQLDETEAYYIGFYEWPISPHGEPKP